MPINVTYPYIFVDGTTIEATQVNADFNAINTLGFANAAQNGANSDITSLSGLTTPLSVAQGGTGSNSGAVGAPTGTVMPFAGGPGQIPTGWLMCDGTAQVRAAYTTLFSVIGTAWGAGDGVTTFNLPDFRGRTLAGYDAANATGRLTGSYAGGANAAALYSAGGEQAHVISAAELTIHNHGILDPGHNHTDAAPGHYHDIPDPGHSHGPSSIYDPGHTHAVNDPGHFHMSFGSNQPPGVGGILQNSTGGSTDAQHNSEVATNGIYLNASATGVELGNTAASMIDIPNTNYGSAVITVNVTGVATNAAGGSNAHNTVMPVAIILWIIKT